MISTAFATPKKTVAFSSTDEWIHVLKSAIMDLLFREQQSSRLVPLLLQLVATSIRAMTGGVIVDTSAELDVVHSFPSLETFWLNFRDLEKEFRESVEEGKVAEFQSNSDIDDIRIHLPIDTGASQRGRRVRGMVFSISPSSKVSSNLAPLLQSAIPLLSTAFKTIQLDAENMEMTKEVARLKRINECIKENRQTKRTKTSHVCSPLASFATPSPSSQAVMCVSNGGMVSYLSETFQHMLGYKPVDILGKKIITDLLSAAEVSDLTQKKGISFLQSADIKPWTFLCKDGTPLEIEVQVEPMKDETSSSVGFVLTAKRI